LAFFGIALLGLHQPVYARRGGGGGGGRSSSGSSSGSGSSGGGSRTSKDRSGSQCYGTSSTANASDPFDLMYGNQWLYKFVGSYYNGSVVSIPAFFISPSGRHWALTVGVDGGLSLLGSRSSDRYGRRLLR